MSHLLTCPHCETDLPVDRVTVGGPFDCPKCQRKQELKVFPAFFRADQIDTGGREGVNEGEASCYFHPGKKAARICDGCGVFICSLCDIDTGKEHLCPMCLEKGTTSRKLSHLRRDGFLYDGLALALALIPLTVFFWFAGFVTIPASLYFAIRYWNKPGGIIPRGKWRLVLAIVLALAQIIMGIVFVSLIVSAATQPHPTRH